MKLHFDIITEDKNWQELEEQYISNIAKVVLEDFPALKNTEVELALMLTNDDHIRRLNKEFRGKDKPTNVLSFPDSKINPKDLLEIRQNREYIYIGDIACSYETISRESKECGLEFQDHFAHMFVHGILHLLGYDHELSEEDEKVMMNKEVNLLDKLSIKSPY